MRYYNFGNYYLSSIQQGIQALHCVVDIIYKYQSDTKPLDVDFWATQHKTVVLLTGGNSQDLSNLADFFSHPDNPYHWGTFSEDEQSLNNALTSVGIVLPEKIYNTAQLIRTKKVSMIDLRQEYYLYADSETMERYDFNDWELNFIELLNTFRMAS